MLLNADEFVKILRQLRSDAGRMTERRKAPRVSIPGLAEIVPLELSDGRPSRLRVRLRDFSQGGIGFLWQRRVPKDWRFVLILPPGEVHEMTGMLCQVVRCATISKGLYQVGCRFVMQLASVVTEQVASCNPNTIAELALDAQPDDAHKLDPSVVERVIGTARDRVAKSA
jgi:hypothetical protein